jgi:hypothetical protein
MTDHLFPGRKFAAPMDADALRNYPILERLGFISITRDTTKGAKEFLQTSRDLLKNPETILWLTPAGKFHDVRKPAPFMAGLSHLVDHEFHGTVIPMAIEYTFWNERLPEMLIQFGSPIKCMTLPFERNARTLELEMALTKSQVILAELAIARDPTGFTTIAMGRGGVGGMYDYWRRVIATLRGHKFQDRHNLESETPAKTIKKEFI